MQTSLRDKGAGYYYFDKSRIAALIPKGAHKVLDVGCAAGMLGRKLRQEDKASELVGIEVFARPAAEAAQSYDTVHVEDIERFELPYSDYFDYVVCGDVLEHLRDPWSTLQQLNRVLKPDGVLIASSPNIRYWRILRDLAIRGKWEYAESGILDDTHLRFFTTSSFMEAVSSANFQVVFHELWVYGTKQGLVNRLTLGALEEFLGSQVLVKAVKYSR